MQWGPKLELISCIDYSCPFLVIYKDIQVVIGGLKMRYLIFIIEYKDHDLVLGQSFLNSVKFSQEYIPNEIFGTIAQL